MRYHTIFLSVVFITLSVVSLHGQSIDQLLGRVLPDDAVECGKKGRFLLKKEVAEAFEAMRKAARRDGVRLKIVSAYRSFDRQKLIWERKWDDPSRSHLDSVQRALDILQYSSMPGTSRHHWGTDMDLNSVEPEFFDKRRGRKIYKWLTENGQKFGFFQPYTEGRSKGYATEKWHWSYGPLSDGYTLLFLNSVTNRDISGFKGCGVTPLVDMIGGWVDVGAQ